MNCAHSVQFSVIDSVLAQLPFNTLLLFNFKGLFPTKYRQSIERLSYGPASVKMEGKLETLTVFEAAASSFFFFFFSGPLWGRGEGAGCSLSQLHYRLVGGSSPACRVAEKTWKVHLWQRRCWGTLRALSRYPWARYQPPEKNTFSEEAQYNLKISQDRILFCPFDGRYNNKLHAKSLKLFFYTVSVCICAIHSNAVVTFLCTFSVWDLTHTSPRYDFNLGNICKLDRSNPEVSYLANIYTFYVLPVIFKFFKFSP